MEVYTKWRGREHLRRIAAQALTYGLLPTLSLGMAFAFFVLRITGIGVLGAENAFPLLHPLSSADLLHSPSMPSAVAQSLKAVCEGPIASEQKLSVLPARPEGILPIVETLIANPYGIVNATEHSTSSTEASAVPALGPTDSDSPTVLVLHTHTTESFFDPKKAPFSGIVLGEEDVFGYYDPNASIRSQSEDLNMVAVGRVFCEELRKQGVSVLHCTTPFDLDYSSAYPLAREAIKEYLEKYPSIEYVLDLHRDSLVRQNGEKLKPTCRISNESCAQVMLVVGAGTAQAPLSCWKENLALSLRYQEYLTSISPDFARPVYLRYGTFNQDLDASMMLLEVGSCGSTLEEATLAAEYAAQAFSEMVIAQKDATAA